MTNKLMSYVAMERFPRAKRGHHGCPSKGNDMSQRVGALEKDLQSMGIDLAVIKSNYATKESVSNAKNSIIMWIVGTILLAQIFPVLINLLKSL